MILRLVYPLEKPFIRIRGFEEHEIWNPGTWYGVDVAPTTKDAKGDLIAAADGTTSHWEKKSTGGGYNFRLNFTKYPGYFMWYAHNSIIPPNRKVFKQGQVIGKSGATGGVTGPHLHFSLMQGSTPKDPDSKSVVKWVQENEVTELEATVKSFIDSYRAILNIHPNATMKKYFLYLAKKGTDPAKWSRNKYYTPQIKKLKDSFDKERKAFKDDSNKIISDLHSEYTKCRDRGVELVGELEGLKAEITTFKEPKGVNIPRVTKFDNLWSKWWKRFLQVIAR